MKGLFLGLIFTALISASHAQRPQPQFGVLTDDEITMTGYAPEPEAPAVVLFDIGNSYFSDTESVYKIRFTRTKRMKILTRAGVERAKVTIHYYYESDIKHEKILSIEASTYLPRDGLLYKKVLEPTNIHDEQVSDRIKAKTFSFPDVQEGSIVEYKYVLETPYHVRLPDWDFQTDLPTLYSEYSVSMIPFYEYVYVTQGITKFDYKNSEVSKKQRTWGDLTDALVGAANQRGFHFNDMVHTFAMKSIPSFTDQSFVTSAQDYIMKIDFQLAKINQPTGGSQTFVTTWPALNKELLQQQQNFGKYLNAAKRGSKKILEKDLKLTPEIDQEKKVESIVSFVRSNYKWNEIRGFMASKSFKEFSEQRHGNIADINLFLTGLLQAADINAEPVLISTRSNGKIWIDYPFAHYFDAVAVMVSGRRTFLVDGTEDFQAYDRVPIRYINEKGLVVSDFDRESVRWIGLEPQVPSIEDITLNFRLDPDSAKAHITGQISATEYEGYEYKKRFKNDSSSFQKFLHERHQMDVSRVSFLSFDKPRLPYIMQFTGTVSLDLAANKLVVQPFLSFPLKTNPFTKPTRNYPVDFIFPRNTKLKTVIQIPEGYKVGALPSPDRTDNELAQIKLEYAVVGSTIEVSGELVLKKAVYPPSDYSRLRNIFVTMVTGFNAPVVLDKL